MDPVYDLNFNVPETWTFTRSRSHTVFTLLSPNLRSRITVQVYQKSGFKSAESLRVFRNKTFYDGWMTLLNRWGTEDENKRASVNSSMVSVYSRQFVGPALQIREEIHGEYCYLVGSTAFVVTYAGFASDWGEIKAVFERFRASFWVGKGIRDYALIFSDFSPSWTAFGGDAANRFFGVEAPSSKSMLLPIWEHSFVGVTLNRLGLQPVMVQDQIILSVSGNVQSFSVTDNTLLWRSSFYISDDYSLVESGGILYAIQDRPRQILALDSMTGDLIFSVPLFGQHSQLTVSDRRLLVIDGQKLRVLDALTGREFWRARGYWDLSISPVADNPYVVVVDQAHRMTVLDLYTGQILWEQLFLLPILHRPVLDKGLIFLSFQGEDSRSYLTAFSLETHTEKWSISFNPFTERLTQAPAVYKRILILPVSTFGHSGTVAKRLFCPSAVLSSSSSPHLSHINSGLSDSECLAADPNVDISQQPHSLTDVSSSNAAVVQDSVRLMAFDTETGRLLWDKPGLAVSPEFRPMIVDPLIFLASSLKTHPVAFYFSTGEALPDTLYAPLVVSEGARLIAYRAYKRHLISLFLESDQLRLKCDK